MKTSATARPLRITLATSLASTLACAVIACAGIEDPAAVAAQHVSEVTSADRAPGPVDDLFEVQDANLPEQQSVDPDDVITP